MNFDVEAIGGVFGPHSSTVGGLFIVLGGRIDVPFCIAVDTVTLPYTIPKSLGYPSPQKADRAGRPEEGEKP